MAVAYVTSMFVSAMDVHIVNVMLPTLTREFETSLSSVQWAVLGYVLSLAIFIPASGWLGDRFGPRRMFIVSLTVFMGASVACGFAQDLSWLVVARVVQGASGGLLTPVATAMLYREYAAHERARMTRVLVMPILLGPILAQPLGGLLVETLTWRWAFFLNVPIGVVTLLVSMLFLVERSETASWRFDVVGFVLVGVGLSALLYALTRGETDGWTSPWTVGAGITGLLLLALFVRTSLRKPEPMLKLVLLRDRIFRATNTVNVLNMAAFAGLLFLAPVFLQQAQGRTALAAGLTSVSTALGVLVASQTVGRVYERVGPRLMAAVGQAGLAFALAAFVVVATDTDLWIIRAMLFLAGFCNSATMIAVQASMFSGISEADTADGSAILNSGRQVATAVGIALLTTVISVLGPARLYAFHGAFVAAAVVAALAGVAAWLLIRDVDAAATMSPVTPVADPAVQKE